MGAGKYEYDAFGRRIKKTKYDPQRTAPVTTLYTWDGEVLAAEIDTEEGPRNFVHAPGTFEPMLQQQNGEVFLCVNDHLGMPKDLVAGDGAVAWSATHSAYGRVVATYADETSRARYGTAINSPFRLLGQVADDDAELCFTRYRCFDPEIGSWISSDPLEIEGGLNLYGFDGAPTDVVDPLGLATQGGGCGGTSNTIHHPSKRAARRAAERDAGMGRHGGRRRLPDQELHPGSQAPQGPRGVRTETESTDTGRVVHHDPYGNNFPDDPSQTVGPHYGVEGPGIDGTIHHTYPSEHDPRTNR
ncbi:MAG: RHS repeat-associated core domain-containing protein [Polyangiaceae bacterium]